MKSHKFILSLVMIIFVCGLVYGFGIGDTPKGLAEKFALYYQQGNIEGLSAIFAPNVSNNGQIFTPTQLGQYYQKSLKRQNAPVIRGIIIIGGLDGFQTVSSGKMKGIVTFRVTYQSNGKLKNADVSVAWTIAKPEGGGEWRIVETDRLAFTP